MQYQNEAEDQYEQNFENATPQPPIFGTNPDAGQGNAGS